MRVVYCFCGHRIEGTTDTDLFQRTRDHQNQAHPANQTTDTQIWDVIKTMPTRSGTYRITSRPARRTKPVEAN